MEGDDDDEAEKEEAGQRGKQGAEDKKQQVGRQKEVT